MIKFSNNRPKTLEIEKPSFEQKIPHDFYVKKFININP